MNLKKNKMGFTMVELIIVIAIIAILAGIIFVAINPAKRFADTRNTRRWADISNVLDAVLKYQVDNQGQHLATIVAATESKYYMIGTGTVAGGDACTTCTDKVIDGGDCLDISGVSPTHIGAIPKDPKSGTDKVTGYYIMKSAVAAGGRITIGACEGELTDVGKINLTR